MHRHYFEHVYNEICVAANRRISRYDLWLLVLEGGGDPEALTRLQVACFVANNLSGFLAEEGAVLDRRARRRLDRRILRFDPRYPTPEESLSRIFGGLRKSA